MPHSAAKVVIYAKISAGKKQDEGKKIKNKEFVNEGWRAHFSHFPDFLIFQPAGFLIPLFIKGHKTLTFAGRQEMIQKLSMEELDRKSVQEFRAAEKTPLVLVLDNIRSMHNVGSVFRTADAFLLQGICLCGFTGRPPHRDIHKTALGATETVDWTYFPTAVEAVKDLKQKGYAVWAIEQAREAVLLQHFQPGSEQPLAVVFGNEVNGVSEEVLPLTDGCIEIPQYGMKHSLNISVSAGIVVWDLAMKIKKEGAES